MPRALITGITGQDGSYLAELLLEHGYEVVGMVRSPCDARIDGVRTVHGDLADAASLRAAMLETRPTSSTTSPRRRSCRRRGRTRPAARARRGRDRDAAGAARELDAAARHGRDVRRDLRRRGRSRRRTSETPMRPRSPYGVAKLAALGLVGTLRHSARHARRQRDRLQPRVAAPAGALPAAQGHARRGGDQARPAGRARARRPRRGARLVRRARRRARLPADAAGRRAATTTCSPPASGARSRELVDAAFARRRRRSRRLRARRPGVRPRAGARRRRSATRRSRASGSGWELRDLSSRR